MAYQREETSGSLARHVGQGLGHKLVLALTFFLALAAVSVSTGLVVYTAWLHDLKNGLFALAFAVLSAKMVLSWVLWRDSNQRRSSQRPVVSIQSKEG